MFSSFIFISVNMLKDLLGFLSSFCECSIGFLQCLKGINISSGRVSILPHDLIHESLSALLYSTIILSSAPHLLEFDCTSYTFCAAFVCQSSAILIRGDDYPVELTADSLLDVVRGFDDPLCPNNGTVSQSDGRYRACNQI